MEHEEIKINDTITIDIIYGENFDKFKEEDMVAYTKITRILSYFNYE